MTPKKGARETFPRVVWQTSHVGPRTLETDFVIVEVSLPRRGSNGRPQISPPAGGVTREIASSPPSPPSSRIKRAKMHAHRSRITRTSGPHAIRESFPSAREKISDILSFCFSSREKSRLASPRARSKVFFEVLLPVILCQSRLLRDCVSVIDCVPGKDESLTWQFPRGEIGEVPWSD